MMDVKKGKRLLILEAAYRLFLERGYTQTKISDIAKEVNIGKGTVYEYFSSKEDIFSALFEYFSDTYIHSYEELAAQHASSSAAEKLKFFVEFDISACECVGTQFPPTSAVELELLRVPNLMPLLQRFIHFQFQTLHGYIREGMDKGEFIKADSMLAAVSILGSLAFFNGFRQNKMPSEILDQIDQTDWNLSHLVDLILYGLCSKDVH